MSEIGVRVVVRDARTYDDLGQCTAPAPVEPGDLVAFEHGWPWRVTSVLPVPLGATVTPVLARPTALSIAAC